MGFGRWLSRILGGSPAEPPVGMSRLSRIDDLEEALARSDREPVFIYKHSSACPISAAAFQRVSAYVESADGRGPSFCIVYVIESRGVSNEIASRLGIPHQSPQLILVKSGRAVWDASHAGVNENAITEALSAAAGV